MELLPYRYKSTNFEELFVEKGKNSQEVFIASAFIDHHTIDLVKEFIVSKKPNARPLIKILTGTFMNFNRKKNLESLLELSTKYSANIRVRISREEAFHWKLYLFQAKNKTDVIVGSANFTKNGLSSTGELIFTNRRRIPSTVSEKYLSTFENEFTSSIPIESFPLAEYEECNMPVRPDNNKLKRKIFETIKNRDQGNSEVKKISIRCIKIQYSLSKNTIKKVERKNTEWVKKVYGYFCFETKSDLVKHHSATHFLNFYRSAGSYFVELGKYIDTDEIPTSEGRYFAAYEFIDEKKITSKMADALLDAGIEFKRHPDNWQPKLLTKVQRLSLSDSALSFFKQLP